MNRREAIAALTSLPAAATVSVASLTADAVIVVTVPGFINEHMAARIKAEIQRVWPNNKVLVLADGLEFKIVRGPHD